MSYVNVMKENILADIEKWRQMEELHGIEGPTLEWIKLEAIHQLKRQLKELEESNGDKD